MTTEFGQRILIDFDDDHNAEEDSSGWSLSGSDNDENDDNTAALMGAVEQAFGNYGSNGGGPTTTTASSCLGQSQHVHTIRFQVVLWNIGNLDMTTGSVPMTFRISLFWNDVSPARQRQYLKHTSSSNMEASNHSTNKKKQSSSSRKRQQSILYSMQGRTKAVPRRVESSSNNTNGNNSKEEEAIDIPPLSILNVSTFTIIGTPEVDLLDPSSRLVRWTCMYRATVMQDRLSVHQFPHDCHELALELAILQHRRAGQRWDRRFWRLALATDEDSRVSRKALRVPYGLIVDHVRIPEFHYHRSNTHHNSDNTHTDIHKHSGGSRHHGGGLQFNFCSQQNGSFDRRMSISATPDVYLRVSQMVLRESGYYDRNIVPLLAFLNVIAATITLILDPEKFFFRGLLILNIAFNQMGVRLSVDKHLPSVGYEIRMQRILNEFFFVLLALILEAGAVYALQTTIMPTSTTYYLKWVDILAGFGALVHNGYTVKSYYKARDQAREKYNQGIVDRSEQHSSRFSSRAPHIV